MNYWQIAAGAGSRDYSASFITFGLAFVGGDTHVETMGKVELGDRVLLKWGKSILAAGQIVEREGKFKGQDDKNWLRDFDGWDLRAYCFVKWHILKDWKPVDGLTRATIQKVHKKHLIKLTDEIITNTPQQDRISPEPSPTRKIEDHEILEFLVEQGLRPGSAEDLTTAFNRIRLLARYYYNNCRWNDIREHETRTFLIIPLLLALGWAEQQIKIELGTQNRQRADVACFSKPYKRLESGNTNDEDCVMIIESKGFSQGLDYAPEQAINYARQFPNCKVVVVSNGYCYKAFKRQKNGSFDPKQLSAYLNLLNPRDRYPLDPQNTDGSLEVLKLLLPYFF
jgi:hypothetical protein